MHYLIDGLLTTIAQISDEGINLPNQVPPRDSGFLSEQIQVILQFTFGLLGALSVMIIIIAAIQYVISAGDAQKVARAKDTIIYAIVGLVVALLSFAIVSFVIDGIFG